MAASPAQIDLVNRLYAERDVPDEVKALVAEKTRVLAPRDFAKVVSVVMGIPKRQARVLEPGTYQDGDVIFRVQLNRETSKPYAKVWNGSRWIYGGNAYRAHAATAVVIPLEQAIEIGVATGHCVCCARDLTHPVSVEAAIGPVCVQRYGTTREEIIASRQREAQTVTA